MMGLYRSTPYACRRYATTACGYRERPQASHAVPTCGRRYIVVATAILASCNEEFEELTTIDIPNYRDGVYSGDNLTFTVDGEPRTVNSVTISSRQVGNDTLYSDNLKKHYLSPIYVTNVIIKGFPGKKDRITIPAISSVDKLRGCINIYPEYYDCFGKFTGSILDRHEFQGLELQLISR